MRTATKAATLAHSRKTLWLSLALYLFLAALLLALSTLRAFAAEPRPLAAEWSAALQPLTGMPVQDYGYVRSAYTFGEGHMTAITNSSKFRGMDALESVLWLMASPEQAQQEKLIKVQRPELVRLFGDKMISLAAYRNPQMQEKLGNMVNNDKRLTNAAGDVDGRANTLESLEHEFAIVPRPGEWVSPLEAARSEQPQDREILKQWEALKAALRANDPAAGGKAAVALTAAVKGSAESQAVPLPRLGLDYFYHRHQPFKKAAVFYLLAAVAFGASLIFSRPGLGWAGWGLLALGFAEQAVGTTARWILAGRAPLSNMYESFTFAIGGMILVALVFELIYRNRLAGLGGGVLGFIFMVLAHNHPIFKSDIHPLMPALQSSWLTYHVVTIMLSYSAFALSFFLSIAYLGKDFLGGNDSGIGLLRRLPSLETLDLFNYKVIVVGFPLLSLGIILGAVWASTAWGRPWGFDPKETWSAITWLIYAIYLHTRYLAGWKGRPAAFLALVGFAGVLFTYLGVNYLPILAHGLHSYAR